MSRVQTPTTDVGVRDSVRAKPSQLVPGTAVEVRRRFDNRWARGFVIESATDEGYTLRRDSDDSVLPVPFASVDLRPRVNL